MGEELEQLGEPLQRELEHPIAAMGLSRLGVAPHQTARAESGEGIEPAIWSGLVAARALGSGPPTEMALRSYQRTLATRAPAGGFGAWMSARLPAALGRTLLSVPPVARLAIDRWFLRTTAA